MQTLKLRTAGAGAMAALLVLAACGDSNDADTPSGSAKADVSAAEAVIAPYVDQPSEFPIDTPLTASPAGKKIAYLDCGTPICGLFSQLAQPAFEQLGMTLTTVKAGLKPDTVQSAFDTVVQGGYDGVFVPAIPPQLWSNGLQALKEADIPVVTTGVVDADPYVQVQQAGTVSSTRSGELLADWVIAKNGDASNVVLYWTPELAFQAVIKDAFEAEMKKNCPGCAVRTVEISVNTFGTTAANTIVADLQAHPDTKTAVFGIGEQTPGLTSQLKTAGLSIESVVNSPDPGVLEELKAGNFSVGLGLDLPVIAWTAADSLARETTGQDPAPGAVDDMAPQQFLAASDLDFDVSHGWTGYPDFAQRFATLWDQAQ